MNVMGMGIMELAVIFLVSFLVLGPSKSIDMARTVGKVIRDLRTAMADMTSAIDLDQTSPPTAPSNKDTPGTPVNLQESPPEKSEDE
jgi:Sec-independent protein translocase protein TatA